MHILGMKADLCPTRAKPGLHPSNLAYVEFGRNGADTAGFRPRIRAECAQLRPTSPNLARKQPPPAQNLPSSSCFRLGIDQTWLGIKPNWP